MSIVYLGLGTNLEPRLDHLREALGALEQQIGILLKCSSFIETKPWGFTSKHDFLNGVAEFETELRPYELLEKTEEIESSMGRISKSINGKYEDRTIDIDILLYDNICINTPQLTIPHPRLHLRPFVVMPLAEIAPDLILTPSGMTAKQLSAEMKNQKNMEETPEFNPHNKAEYPPMHTAEHILNGTMDKIYGCGRAFSSHIERTKSKLDYHLPKALTEQDVRNIEKRVNDIIKADLNVWTESARKTEVAERFDLTRLPKDASEYVRIVHVGDYDECLCVGNHVNHTSEIGHFRISSSRWNDGVQRIVFRLDN